MLIKTLKAFQTAAVDSAIAVFRYAQAMLDAAGTDEPGRATAIHGNGYLLIEAPTGSGKTLMAGNIVEQMSNHDRVVWFWFAPFKGVVDQSAAFLREQFQGLRLRTLTDDRNGSGSRSGDVFVTTWSLVATRLRDRRSVRQSGELNGSVDDLVVSLREQGFRIGVVVDEAHHGFHGDTQAAVFFRSVLKPEYTVLVTATPDDDDIKDLQRRMQISHVHRITVSRADAVESGLIKSGIKCIAWRVAEGSSALVDFETNALREGTILHRQLKAELTAIGVNLTPLLLVQVDSRPRSVEKAKEKLIAAGFTDAQIAVHTADEPDAGLMALANDETREVLIFKMSVALGFDAPRAWALVSMRASRDEDFGVQLVGRILRVHRRLQGRKLPPALQYGYVLLADIDSQSGIDAAGQSLNQLQTAYAAVSPTTVIVRVGDNNLVQRIDAGGQTTFVPTPPPGAIFNPPAAAGDSGLWTGDAGQSLLFATADAPEIVRSAVRAALAVEPIHGRYHYPLKPDVPRHFKSQDFPPDFDISEDDCAEHFAVSANHLYDALVSRDRVKVEKRTLEIFTREIQMEFGFAPPSLDQIQRRVQHELTRLGMFDPRLLRAALVRKIHFQLAARNVEDATNDDRLNEYLDLLIYQHPELLREAQLAAMAAAAQIRDAAPLPLEIDSDFPLTTSRLNVYGAFPDRMNNWEKEFAGYLDSDDTGTVLWWHRNPSRKPWSINVLLESGRGFFPDFVIGIKSRPTYDHGLLADTKYAFETSRELPKILASHAAYGRVLILTKQGHLWATAGINPVTGAAYVDQTFKVAAAHAY